MPRLKFNSRSLDYQRANNAGKCDARQMIERDSGRQFRLRHNVRDLQSALLFQCGAKSLIGRCAPQHDALNLSAVGVLEIDKRRINIFSQPFRGSGSRHYAFNG